MSNLKKIGNKLFKETTELKSHEVELGLHDDMLKWEKRGDDSLSLAKKNINDVITTLQSVKHDYKVAEGILDEAMKMAKELGATNLINIYSKRESSIKGGLKEVSKMTSKLKSI